MAISGSDNYKIPQCTMLVFVLTSEGFALQMLLAKTNSIVLKIDSAIQKLYLHKKPVVLFVI